MKSYSPWHSSWCHDHSCPSTHGGLPDIFGNLFCRFLATSKKGGIPAYMPGKHFCKVLLYYCFMDPVSKTTSGKFGKARKQVDSDGISPKAPNPHIRRRFSADCRALCRSLVTGCRQSAFATNARTIAIQSSNLQPGERKQVTLFGTCCSIWTISRIDSRRSCPYSQWGYDNIVKTDQSIRLKAEVLTRFETNKINQNGLLEVRDIENLKFPTFSNL